MTILQNRQQQILQRGADSLRSASRALRSASNPQLEESDVVAFIDVALRCVVEALRLTAGEIVVIKRDGDLGDVSWRARVDALSEAAGFIDTLAVHFDHAKYATLVGGYRLALGRCIQPGAEVGNVAQLAGRRFAAVDEQVSAIDPVVLRQAN